MVASTARKQVEKPAAFQDINIRWIPVRKLKIKWPAAQRRDKIITHIKKIAGNFDPDKFGVIIITMADDDGNYHIIDGAHRVAAIELMWGKDEAVPCQIIPTRDAVRAAEIFLGMTEGRRAITPIDKFLVSVTAGNPDSININKVIRSLGYRINNSRADGCISAVGALRTAYLRYGPDVLYDALSVIQATWGLNSVAVSKPIILAYANVIGNNFTTINQGRLKEVIKKRFPNPDVLLGLVKGLKELSGKSVTEVIYGAILDNYNRGLKTGQLLKD